MFDLLLAVEHLPALDAEHFTVALGFDEVEFVDERCPFFRITFNHGIGYICSVR